MAVRRSPRGNPSTLAYDSVAGTGETSTAEKSRPQKKKPVTVSASGTTFDARLYARGAASNAFGLTLLGSLAIFVPASRPAARLACALQLAVFVVHGLPFRSEEFYDLSGSVTHFAVVVQSLLNASPAPTPRGILVSLASVLWMTRLGTFLFLRIARDGRDARFDSLKPCWLSFLGAWTIQAAWVTLTELPIVLCNARAAGDQPPLGLTDAALAAAWGAGFVLEVAADMAKFTFRNDPANRAKFITGGVWGWSRHPNYFGEIAMWVALAAVVTLCAGCSHAAWISPAFTALLLLKISGVPMVEKAGMKKWGNDPEYLHYVKHTSCIIPWRPAPPLS